jgi:PAS domain S-box-containing protein
VRTARRQGSARPARRRKVAELRARLAEAQETLRAIRSGEVDAVVVTDTSGPRVYTLEGAEHAYRVLIESMNEGALTLTANNVILYANQCFAKMVKCPLERVMGASFSRFLSTEDRQTLRVLLKRADIAGSRIQALLKAGDGSQMPVLISIRPLAKGDSKSAAVGMVMTDMTEARRNEELLRGLSHRLVQAQEAERGRVALELHDHITQLLCAIHARSQALADKLSARDGSSRQEAMKLRDMLGQTAEEVERISRDLRPGILSELGLVAVLRSDSAKFAERTGVPLRVTCVELIAGLSAEAELAFYRILQEALKNVEKHARARHAAVRLTQQGAFVEMVINDDGIGFDPEQRPARRKAQRGFGLLSMRERAASVGGALSVQSAPGQGTTVCARVPCAPRSGPTPAHPAMAAS